MRLNRTYIGLPILFFAVWGCGTPPPPKAESVASGDALFQRQDYRGAAAAYRAAVAADAQDGSVRLKLARTYALLGSGLATQEAARAADLLPNDNEAQLVAAYFHLAAKSYVDAGGRASAILAKEPDNVQALEVLANSKAQLPSRTHALALLDDMRRSTGSYDRARHNLRPPTPADEDREAETMLRKAVAIAPDNIDVRLSLANLLWAAGKFAEGEPPLKIVAERSTDGLPSRVLAGYYLSKERDDEAEQFLQVARQRKDPVATLVLADHYLARQRYAEARALLGQVPDAAAGDPAVASRLAAAEFGDGERSQAMQRIDALLAQQPNNVDASVMKAEFHSARGEWTEAVQVATSARRLAPANPAAMSVLGYALVQVGQVQQGYDLLNEGLRLKPADDRMPLRLAQAAILLGRGAEAVTAARVAKLRHAGDRTVAVTFARALTMQGEFAAAERELQPALTGAPPSPELLTLDGRIQAGLGNVPRARAALNRALTLDPKHLEALEAIIELDLQQRELAAAGQRIAQLTRDAGASPRTWLLAARVYAAQSDVRQQEAALRQALTLEAGQPRASLALAALLNATGKAADGEQALETSLKSYPDHPDVSSALAAQLARTGRSDRAKTLYERLVGRYPEASPYKARLAVLMVERGDNLEIALSLASDARKQAPADPEAADALGWVYVSRNLPQLALPHLTEAVKKAPGVSQYQYHLGFAYLRLSRRADAETHLQNAITLDPKFPDADKARSALEQLRRSRPPI